MNKVTKRLENVVMEDTYSKTGILNKIKEEIEHDVSRNLSNIFLKCCMNVQAYKNKQYWLSKDVRINWIQLIPLDELVLEIFVAVISNDKITPIQAVASKLGGYLSYDDVFDSVRTAAELIAVCKDTGLYEIWNDPLEIQSKVLLSQGTMDFIDKCKYLNPMTIEPDRWTNHYDGGYISVKKHVILKPFNVHIEKQAFDGLNIAQSIAWKLDPFILDLNEVPKKPLDTRNKVDAFELRRRNSEVTYQELGDSSFWFKYNYDSRGRMYSQGYYVNHQSDEYRKAMLSFAHKQLIV